MSGEKVAEAGYMKDVRGDPSVGKREQFFYLAPHASRDVGIAGCPDIQRTGGRTIDQGDYRTVPVENARYVGCQTYPVNLHDLWQITHQLIA